MIINKIKRAFTLTEMIMVIAIIGILMMGMTVYIGGSSEKTKIIEAEGCASTIGGVMDNYLYYALTSRMLYSGNTSISPNFYYIQLSGGTSSDTHNCIASNFTGHSPIFCNKIVFSYSSGDLAVGESPTVYETHTIQKTCRQNQSRIGFYRSGGTNDTEKNIEYIKMNKGFSPTNITDQNVFYMQNKVHNSKLLLGEIIIVLCSDDECSGRKEIAKRVVDARPQTISLKSCKFYEEDDTTICKEWED